MSKKRTSQNVGLQLQLRTFFVNKKKQNPRYSLRGMARRMNIDSSYLSKLLTGERTLSPQMAKKVAEFLKLGEGARPESSPQSYNPFEPYDVPVPGEISAYSLEHEILVHSLNLTRDVSDLETIRTRLGWPTGDFERVFNDLLKGGMVAKRGNRYRSVLQKWAMTSKSASSRQAVAAKNRKLYKRAMDTCHNPKADERYFHLNFTFNEEDIPRAFEILRMACFKIARLSEKKKEKHTGVYSISGSILSHMGPKSVGVSS